MVLPSCSWAFSDSLGHHRLDLLKNAPPFEEIARSIATLMRIQCSHPDPCHEADGFKRLVVCLEIDRPLFDLFFNSYNGYRAAYFRSPGEGMNANAVFFQIVAPALLKTTDSNNCGLGYEFKHQSLMTPSAKVWLAEHTKEVDLDCPGCKGEWSSGTVKNLEQPEILNGVWEQSEKLEAKWGCKAPYLTKLRVMGAFLDDQFNEWIPSVKRFRAKEIHERGWS